MDVPNVFKQISTKLATVGVVADVIIHANVQITGKWV